MGRERDFASAVANRMGEPNAHVPVTHTLPGFPVSFLALWHLKSESSELPEADRKEMLESMDLKEPALATLAREAYRLLGLHSYFTAGPKEIRAWQIPVGATDPQYGGVIHTDFERGFIRAETYNCQDLFELGSEGAIKEAGKYRSEGKDYVVQDGDVLLFRFNV